MLSEGAGLSRPFSFPAFAVSCGLGFILRRFFTVSPKALPKSAPLFDASRRLLSYAETKLHDLEAAISRHIEHEVEVFPEHYPHMFYVVANIKGMIPDALQFQVVETVGHVRAALDKMVAEMVIANGCGASGVGFPFGGLGSNGLPEPFPTSRHDKVKKKLSADQWVLILAQKPHPGGNDALWSVNTVANASKHGPGLVAMKADLTPTFGKHHITAYMSPLSRSKDFPGEIRISGSVPSDAVGKYRVAQVISCKGYIEFRKTMRIIFADVAPVSDKDVLVVIDEQIRLAKQMVDLFAAMP